MLELPRGKYEVSRLPDDRTTDDRGTDDRTMEAMPMPLLEQQAA